MEFVNPTRTRSERSVRCQLRMPAATLDYSALAPRIWWVEAFNYSGDKVVDQDLIERWGPFPSYERALVAGRLIRDEELVDFAGFSVRVPGFDDPPWDSADGPVWEEGDSVLLSIREEEQKEVPASCAGCDLVGRRVRLHSLVKRESFNGAEGLCVGVRNDSTGVRAVVKLDHKPTRRKRAVKGRKRALKGVSPANLEFIDVESSARSEEDGRGQSREMLQTLFSSLLPLCIIPGGELDQLKLRRLMDEAVQSSLPPSLPPSSPNDAGSATTTTFRRVKDAEAEMVARLIEKEAPGGVRGLGVDVGTGEHGFGLMKWAFKWHHALKWYPTDCTQLLGSDANDHAENNRKSFEAQCKREASAILGAAEATTAADAHDGTTQERANAVAELPSRWLRLDVFEDERAWRTEDRDTQLCRLRGRATVVTCVDLLSVFKAGDVRAGRIRRPRVVLDVLRCFATFMAHPSEVECGGGSSAVGGGIGIWLDRGLGDERHFGGEGGKVRRLLPRLAEGFGLVATEVKAEVLLDSGDIEGAPRPERVVSDPCFVLRWNASEKPPCTFCGRSDTSGGGSAGEEESVRCCCGIARYCGAACARKDWAVHSHAHWEAINQETPPKEPGTVHREVNSDNIVDTSLIPTSEATPTSHDESFQVTKPVIPMSDLPPPQQCAAAWREIDLCLQKVVTNDLAKPCKSKAYNSHI